MDGVKKLTFIPDVLYHYYLRSSSQIHNLKVKDIENLKKYLLVVKEHAKEIGKEEEYAKCLSAWAFLHLGISWAHMVSYDKDAKINEVLKDIRKYLDDNFPTWKTNEFFKLSHCIKKGFKSILIWGVHLFYRMRLPIVYIWVNKFLVDVLKVEVKW